MVGYNSEQTGADSGIQSASRPASPSVLDDIALELVIGPTYNPADEPSEQSDTPMRRMWAESQGSLPNQVTNHGHAGD